MKKIYKIEIIQPKFDELYVRYSKQTPSKVKEEDLQLNFSGKEVFIIHGHNEELKKEVAETIKSFSLIPIILHERPNKGRTIIEKLEEEGSKVGFAVALLTPDDIYIPGGSSTTISRARQNVILEMGYFMGLLGRNRVCAICFEGVERPSDIDGLLYISYDNDGEWKEKLAKEIGSAGIQIEKC
jgi:predicted nucleotide-binding protein